ncbi:MAG TPA: hypothetical protein VIR57_00080 [Chloroflexota bacterium]|jgi:hypothetical protein
MTNAKAAEKAYQVWLAEQVPGYVPTLRHGFHAGQVSLEPLVRQLVEALDAALPGLMLDGAFGMVERSLGAARNQGFVPRSVPLAAMTVAEDGGDEHE